MKRELPPPGRKMSAEEARKHVGEKMRGEWNKPPRDPKRIPELLEAIKQCWEKYPDARLCQLISWFSRGAEDVFYLEDDELLKRLRKNQ